MIRNIQDFKDFFGIDFNLVKSLKEDVLLIKDFRIRGQEFKCPKIAFNHRDQEVRIYYFDPNYGQVFFSFDPNDFYYADKEEQQLLFKGVASDIFKFFSITPTVVKKIYHLSLKRSGVKKLELQPKLKTIAKSFFPDSFVRIAEDKELALFESQQDLNEELERCLYNMDLAVLKAARSFDLGFFDYFFENFKEYAKIAPKSLKIKGMHEATARTLFNKKVVDLQKTLES